MSKIGSTKFFPAVLAAVWAGFLVAASQGWRKTRRLFAPLPTLRDRHLRMLGHDPYQRKSIPVAFRLSVFWGEFNEMNASARREDLCAYLGYALSGPAGRPGHMTSHRSSAVRSSTLGWMLLTGLACSSPLHTDAADWLSSSSSTAAESAATAAAPAAPTAPTPPLPPSPPAATRLQHAFSAAQVMHSCKHGAT